MPELESTLSLLTTHRSVLGYLILSRTHPVSIIRQSGVIFDGEQGKRYAGVIGRIVESVQAGLDEVSGGGLSRSGPSPVDTEDGVRSTVSLPMIPVLNGAHLQDEIRFMRIRTKRHEIMISPGLLFHLPPARYLS
jgi:dynein light chain roadblock-type